MNNCLKCGKETNSKFCSRSCSNSYNNSLVPKRIKKQYTCIVCGVNILSRRKYCKNCGLNKDHLLKDIMYTKHNKASAYALVRTRARSIMKNEPQVCNKCGYDKHVEVCHIKPISSFSENTLVSVINDKNNLILLCPNCHW